MKRIIKFLNPLPEIQYLFNILRTITKSFKTIFKLIWANRELYRQILAEIRDIAVVLIFIVVLIWFTLNGISETQENYRLNHLESRMNSFDRNIPDMTVIE